METGNGEERRINLGVIFPLFVLVIIAVIAFFFVASVYLQWTVLQRMYLVKFGLDWFNTVFYQGYTFVVPALIALAVVNPFPGKSDLLSFVRSISLRRGLYSEDEGTVESPRRPAVNARVVWLAWQVTKWLIAYAIAYPLNGFLFFPHITNALMFDLYGYGSWSMVPRIIALPLYPASGEEIVALIPTMEAQYYLIVGTIGTVLLIIGVRFFLKLMRDLSSRTGNRWIIDALVIGLLVSLSALVGAPYWLMNVMTPYFYFVLLLVIIGFVYGIVYFKLSGKGLIPVRARWRMMTKVAAVIIAILLVVNVGALVYLSVNWNNNWLQYSWSPQIQKQIAVTRWSAGLSNINVSYVSDIPTGNVTQVLAHVRQWDNNASYIRSQSQIGVNYLAIPNSEIVYLNNNEYWLQPTTIIYPPNGMDWISQHLIYTHADRIIVLNAHTGTYGSLSQALGIPPNPKVDDPLIYYGESGGFVNEVYVNVRDEPPQIGGASYTWAPDYTLSGLIRTLWFFIQGPSTWGFAFTPPQDAIEMLYNRDVFSRVSTTLTYGLTVDPQAYLVTDGSQLYYAMQVYIDYPLQTGFAQSNYLRNFAVIIVNVNDGSMHPYIVDKSSDFISSFFMEYYPSWNQTPPAWLVPQIRYPEQLLGNQNAPGQLDVDFSYHVNTPSVWRSGSEFYERPPATRVYYILVNEGNNLYYVGLQLAEFVLSPGHNLGGIYVAHGGDRLNQLSLYRVDQLSNSTNKIIGPRAALQGLETNPQIKEQLTLLTNPTLGNVLPYLVNGQVFYFIPVYVNTGESSAVITKLAFMVVVDANNGVSSLGQSSSDAFNSLLALESGGQRTVKSTSSLASIVDAFASKGYKVIRPSVVNVNLEFQVGTITLNNMTDSQVNSVLNTFIDDYAVPKSGGIIYEWSSGSVTNFGVIVNVNGVTEAYYISVT